MSVGATTRDLGRRVKLNHCSMAIKIALLPYLYYIFYRRDGLRIQTVQLMTNYGRDSPRNLVHPIDNSMFALGPAKLADESSGRPRFDRATVVGMKMNYASPHDRRNSSAAKCITIEGGIAAF
jgi:hypothetical protein